MPTLARRWLPLLLCCAAALALPLPEERDSVESRKVLGSSVVTSVSVVMDNENGTNTAYFADAAGKPVQQPKEGGEVGSPIDLLSPDRYQFYTFDEAGNLITRYMTRSEVKSIIANGQKNSEMQQESPTFYHNLPPSVDEHALTPTEDEASLDSFSQSQMKMHSVVASVQNVLKGHMEESLLDQLEPTGSLPGSPDTSSSWSLILPSYLGNNVAEEKTETVTTSDASTPLPTDADAESVTASSESLPMADAPATSSAETETEASTSNTESEDVSSETSETEENLHVSSAIATKPTAFTEKSTSASSTETSNPTISTEVKNTPQKEHHSHSSDSSEEGSGEPSMLLVPLVDTPVKPILTSSEKESLNQLVETLPPGETYVTVPNNPLTTSEDISEEQSEETHATEPAPSNTPSTEVSTSATPNDKTKLSSTSKEEVSTVHSDETTSQDSAPMGDAPYKQDSLDDEDSHENQSNDVSASLSIQTEENVSTPKTVGTNLSTKDKLSADNKNKFTNAVSESASSEENSSSTSSDHIIKVHKENHNEDKKADTSTVATDDVEDSSTSILSLSSSTTVTESSNSNLDENESKETYIKVDTKLPEEVSTSENSDSEEYATTVPPSHILNVNSILTDAITSVLTEVTNQAVLGASDEEIKEHFLKISSSTMVPSSAQSASSEKVSHESETLQTLDNEKVNHSDDEDKSDEVVVVSVSSSQSSQSSSSSVSTETKDDGSEISPNRHELEGAEKVNNNAEHIKVDSSSVSETHMGAPENIDRVEFPILIYQTNSEKHTNKTHEIHPNHHHGGHHDKTGDSTAEIIKLTEETHQQPMKSTPEHFSPDVEHTKDTAGSVAQSSMEKQAEEMPAGEASVPADKEEVAAVESKDPLEVPYVQVPLRQNVNQEIYLKDLATEIYDTITEIPTTVANALFGEMIDISTEEHEAVTKKRDDTEAGEGSGEGSGSGDDEDNSQGSVSAGGIVEEGSGSGSSEKVVYKNANREVTTTGYTDMMTTLRQEIGEQDAANVPDDSNDNKISDEQSSDSGSGDGSDQSNGDVPDSENLSSPSSDRETTSESVINLSTYLNGNDDFGLKVSSQTEGSESGNSESTERTASSASLYDLDKYIQSSVDLGIKGSTSIDKSGSTQSESTEIVPAKQSNEDFLANSSITDSKDGGSIATSAAETAAAETNDSQAQNDANMSPEFGLKTSSISGNSESDKSEQNDASLSQGIYDLEHYLNSDKDIGIIKPLSSEESVPAKSEKNDGSQSDQIDASLSQSMYDINHYLNSDKDFGIKTTVISDETVTETSDQTVDKMSSENVSTINDNKSSGGASNESPEKPSTVDTTSQEHKETIVNSSASNNVESSVSESSQEDLVESTTISIYDIEMNDQHVIDSSFSNNEEQITTTEADSKPQEHESTSEETKDENIKYYKTDIHSVTHTRPKHPEITIKKQPGKKPSSEGTSWTKVDVISPDTEEEQTHERTPAGSSHTHSHSEPALVELHPAPEESLGLEASTVHLFEDVQRFADLCNELAFKTWLSVTHKGVSAARSLVMSPFAVTSLLSMIFLGARGPTSGQMNDILRLDDMMTFNPHQVFRNVTESLVLEKNPGVSTAAIVRELYSDKSKGKMLEFYKHRATQFYDGHVEEVNFANIGDTVRRRTNLLVKRQTSSKISEYMHGSNLVLQSPLAAFSANIFQTDCSSASTEGRDGEMYFTILPATRQRRLVPIPAVVYRSGFMAGYEPSLDATVVSLGGHESPISTLLVLPGQQGQLAPGDGLPRLEQHLFNSSYVDGAWSKLLRSLLVRNGLEIQLPRFSHRSQLNLTHSLQSMGLNDLFDPAVSDLKGLSGSGHNLHVSDVIQVNTFSTCGEEVVGARHHVEIYPGTPHRTSREDVWASEEEEEEHESAPVSRPRRARLDSHHEASGFEDLVEESVYQMPLALRPRQARIPEGEETHARLKFDRPFLYFVRHNPTGFILHMGRFNPRLMH